MARTFHWDELLSEVAKRIPPQQFRAWLEPTTFIEINDQSLVISAPTVFSRDWINDHYRETFKITIFELYGLRLDLKVQIGQELTTDGGPSDSSAMLTLPRTSLLESSLNKPPSSQERASASIRHPSMGEQQTTGPLTSPSNTHSLPNDLPLFDFGKKENAPPPSQPVSRAKTGSLRDDFEQAGLFATAKSGSQSHLDMQSEPVSHHQSTEPVAAVSVREMTMPVIRTLGQPLDPKHTFETFVVGASNQFAHAAARAVAEQPATQYNPLFIYSDAGLGKTHLLHAIGNYVLKLNPKAKICYLSAEKFVNDLIDSIHHGKMSQFREKYRDSYDMLLMDDIQFIAGKDRTQEEFFHTFNALHSSRRQIVVTSDKFPKDIPGLEDRIRTRFEWGLIADIQAPEIETRIAILRAKAEMDDIFLPNDVALFLASNIKSNIRELEGSLIRLGAQASLSGSEISLDLAKQLLRNIIKEPLTTISVDAIQDAVARHFSVKVSDIKSKERSRRVALPRQITMYLIRKYCGKSYPDIGILLGGKDHSTVLHGVKSISEDIEKDPEIRRHVEEIQNSL